MSHRQTKLIRVTMQQGDAVTVEATSTIRSVKCKHNRQGGSGGRAVVVIETPIAASIRIDKTGRYKLARDKLAQKLWRSS